MVRTIWADEPGHVFNYPENLSLGLVTEGNFLANIRKRHLLGCCDNYGTIGFGGADILDDRYVFVRSARRGIDDEIVQIPPGHIGEELPDESVLARTPPDDCFVLVVDQEPD